MPKKTRKKSPKSASPTKARAQSRKSTTKGRAQNRPAKARKSGITTSKMAKATDKPSQKTRSKKLITGAPRPLAKSTINAVQPESAKRTSSKSAAKPHAHPSGLMEGAKAPPFRLPRDGGGTVSLSDYSGKKLVLFFYPRADTPGCTREAIDFTRLSGAFAACKTAVLGISADQPKAQEAFRDKHQLKTPLVSDEQHTMLEAYGVWGEKSMYGRTFQGILRTTVLVGPDGRVLQIWRNVKVDGHADEVLERVRAL
jgi:thioredoxin-dependent peroxiredoxin